MKPEPKADEIEITESMIKAGVRALLGSDVRVEGPEEVVIAIWEAMKEASTRQ